MGRTVARELIMTMGAEKTNLRALRPSRKKPVAGDVFVMQLLNPNEKYQFGRVISTEAEIGPMKDVILIYIYRLQSDSKNLPERSDLSPERLLVSPIMTNRLPWSKGYFETVAHWPIEPADLLPQHCFLSAARGVYFDEYGNKLSGAIEPVGDWGLHSYRTIDDEISDAVGTDRAPE